MKRFLAFLATGAASATMLLALGLSSTVQAQTGGVEGGALLVHDAFGHTITILAPSPASGDFTVTLPNSAGILSTGGLTSGSTNNSTLRWDAGSSTWMENLNVTSTSIGGLTAVSFSGDGSALTSLTGANVVGDISGNAGGLTGTNLSGDVTNSGNAITVNSYNGGTTFGSMAGQSAASVAITGGTIDGTAIGGTTTAAGAFTVVTADNVSLPGTTSLTVGTITMSGSSWTHAFGLDNTFLGLGAGNFTSATAQNVGIGTSSQANLTTGNENTSVGAYSLGVVTVGGSNTAVGNYALENTINGNSNTAVGNTAGLTIVAGTDNTFLGNGADADVAGRINATAIGSGAIVTADNSIQLGNGSVTAVNTAGTITAGAGLVATTDVSLGGHVVSTGAQVGLLGTPDGTIVTNVHAIPGSTDVAGTVVISTSATTGEGSGVITFATPYAFAPRIVITPANLAAQNDNAGIAGYYVTSTNADFVIQVKNGGSVSSAQFNYMVIQHP